MATEIDTVPVCPNHPPREADGRCAACGSPRCSSCLVQFLGEPHCGPCRDERLRFDVLPEEPWWLDSVSGCFFAVAGALLFLSAALWTQRLGAWETHGPLLAMSAVSLVCFLLLRWAYRRHGPGPRR